MSEQSKPVLARPELEEKDKRLNVRWCMYVCISRIVLLIRDVIQHRQSMRLKMSSHGQKAGEASGVTILVSRFVKLTCVGMYECVWWLRLIPSRIEFWKGRENRIHDRICYVRQGTPVMTVFYNRACDCSLVDAYSSGV